MYVSVVMTTYNVERYVVEALQSVVNQTHPHFEIIIVDDGSIDHTPEIIQTFTKNHPSIDICFFQQAHIGRANVLQWGVDHAKYDWIAILDADDVWHHQKLALQTAAIHTYHLDFLATDSTLFGEGPVPKDIVFETIKQKYLKKISLSQLLINNLISHSSLLAKKNLLKYDTSRKRQIDYECWLRLMSQGESLWLLDMKLTYHRLHQGQFFESKQQFIYLLGCTQLQFKYALIQKRFLLVPVLILKMGYYFLFPKKIRLKIRSALLSLNVIRKLLYTSR